MSGIEWVRQHYGVDARLRRRIVFDGKPGRITGTYGGHLVLRLDERPNRKVYVHPKWRMEYPVADQLAVHRMEWGGGIVRGTTNPVVACLALDAYLVAEGDLLPEDLPAASRMRVQRIGWFRTNPCHPSSCYDPSGEHRWHLGYVDGPGCGAWQGVLLDG